MSTPAEALQEDELNLSDLIHTSSPSPAPRSHFVSTPQTSMPASGPSPIPVLTLVCKRTNQPLTPPVQTQVSPRALQMASWSLAALSSPREHSSNTFQPVAFELPSQTPQVHKDNDCSPHALPAPSPISSSYPSVPPAHSPAFSLSEIQQSHATITHLTQQLTLLKHQRDLLTHQRDIFIAQREEERVKFDAQRAAWERLAEALIAQNARESAAGIGRKAVETAEKYALRVEDDNRSLRQKLLDANTRLTTLEKELDRLRPLLMVSIQNDNDPVTTSKSTTRSVNDSGNLIALDGDENASKSDTDAQRTPASRQSAEVLSVPPPPVPKRRRRAKLGEASQPLIPVPIKVSYHRASPLSGDARAECMLSVAKTLGRRKLAAMAQLGMSATWDLRSQPKDGQAIVGMTNEGVAEVEAMEVDQPAVSLSVKQKYTAIEGRKSSISSSHSQASSFTKQNAILEKPISRTKKTNAIPIVPITASTRSMRSSSVQSRGRIGDVVSTCGSSAPEEVTLSPSTARANLPSTAQIPSSLQPRRRGRPKGSKNKKREVQVNDDNVDDDPNGQPSQGFHSLLSAAMTLEGSTEEQTTEEITGDVSLEESSGLRRTRRQTAKAQAVGIDLHSRKRLRPKELPIAEIQSSPPKRRKVAPSASSPILSSPSGSRANSPSEHSGLSNASHLTPSRTVDGIARIRSALDVLADQAIQGERRPPVASSTTQKSLYSFTQSVRSLSLPRSAELDTIPSVPSIPQPMGSDVRPADAVALTLPPGTLHAAHETGLAMLNDFSPLPAIDATSSREVDKLVQPTYRKLNDPFASQRTTNFLPISLTTPPRPSTPAEQHNQDDSGENCERSRSLSDRDASGEPEDPEEVDMVVDHHFGLRGENRT